MNQDRQMFGPGFAAGAVILILALGAYFFFSNLSAESAYQRVTNSIEAKQLDNKAAMDAAWKIVSQQGQVAQEYRGAFEQAYTKIMDARYQGGGGEMFQMISEANPQFDVSLYKTLMRTIESQRITFRENQRELIDLSKEQKNLVTTAPTSWFLKGKPITQIQIVTSARTEESFATGREDDVSVFGGNDNKK